MSDVSDRDFLESYPLYRKFMIDVPTILSALNKPAIHLDCPVCGSAQTFNMENEFYDGVSMNTETNGMVLRAVYICESCREFRRYFLLMFDPEGKYISKVGQHPAPDISIDKRIGKLLGSNVELYKKGRICESQSYGIGAFAYYRRLLEETISALLDEIADLVAVKDRDVYMKGLENVGKEKTAENKIAVAKNLLPPNLISGGVNPLATLYDILSVGLHAKSDDDCIGLAVTVRQVFESLIIQIDTNKSAAKILAESTRKLLAVKSKS